MNNKDENVYSPRYEKFVSFLLVAVIAFSAYGAFRCIELLYFM